MLFAVLSRVKDFLPTMAAANTKLEESMKELGPEAFDIENVDESEKHVEMVSTKEEENGN